MAGRNVSGVTLAQFFTAVLKGMGAPVTQNNLNKLGAVAATEGHGGDYNPFNYVSGPGSNFNSAGVKNYPDIATGVAWTVKLLTTGKAGEWVNSNLMSDGSYADFIQKMSGFYHTWGGGSITVSSATAAQKVTQQIDGPGVSTQELQGILNGTAVPGGGSGTAGGEVQGAYAAPAGPVQLPDGGTIYNIQGIGQAVVYDVGNGVRLSFGLPWWDPSAVAYDRNAAQNISQDAFNALGTISAGDAQGLGNVKATYGSFGKFWDSIIGQTIGYNNPAVKDPGVLKVLAEFAARPDMSQTELENKLKATGYWQSLDISQQQWNDLPEAEKNTQRADMQARMIDTIFQYMGVRVDPSDPMVSGANLEQVASGAIGFGAWTQSIKQQAIQNDNSPYSRQIRDEQRAQKQDGIDIENTANQLRETLDRWGLQWSDKTLNQWALDIVNKNASDDDFMKQVKAQAQSLYPWKDAETETDTAAQPWIQAYSTLMEKDGSVFTPEVQQALQGSMTVFDFQKMLKQSPQWAQTQNGQNSIQSTMDEVGKTFGFIK